MCLKCKARTQMQTNLTDSPDHVWYTAPPSRKNVFACMQRKLWEKVMLMSQYTALTLHTNAMLTDNYAKQMNS